MEDGIKVFACDAIVGNYHQLRSHGAYIVESWKAVDSVEDPAIRTGSTWGRGSGKV
jgi:hypothetical protein